MASTVPNNKNGGRKKGHKFKSLLVWQYLLKNTDENHAVASKDIIDYLDAYGITADRHSISRDIQELQELFDKDYDADVDERDRLRYEIVYDTRLKGYKVVSRPYEFGELRLLAECINSAKFLTENQADHLKEMISEFCSGPQAEELQNEVYLIGRVKTENKTVMSSILKLNDAIKKDKKVSFKYLKYTIQNKGEQVERRRGNKYVVSPFRLLINEGNYYLLAYDSKKQDTVTFRIDRMKGTDIEDDQREGHEVFAEIDMSTYTQRVFSMFGGEEKRVSIRFQNHLLDSAIEKFGTGKDVFYMVDDKNHFIVSTNVEISDQFYAWICGFRKRAKIVSPPEVVEGMKQFLDDVYGRYAT